MKFEKDTFMALADGDKNIDLCEIYLQSSLNKGFPGKKRFPSIPIPSTVPVPSEGKKQTNEQTKQSTGVRYLRKPKAEKRVGSREGKS